MSKQYYSLSLPKLKFAEIWRIANSKLEFVFASIFKILRVNLQMPVLSAYPEDLILVHARAVPEHILEKLTAALDECRSHDIKQEFFYKTAGLGPQELFAWCGLLPDQKSIFFITCNRVTAGAKVEETITHSIISIATDGVIHSSSKKPRQLAPNSSVKGYTYKGTSVTEFAQRHREFVSENVSVRTVADRAELEQIVIDSEQREMEYLIQRKVLVPAPEDVVRIYRNWKN